MIVFVTLLVLSVPLFVLVAWLLAYLDIFFGFLQENTGFAKIVGDNQLQSMQIASKSQHLKRKVVQHPEAGAIETWVLEQGADPNPAFGLIGWMERKLGVYWIGVWPFQRRYRYEMFRTVFDRSADADENTILRKNDQSKFFYVQPVEYAFSLLGAETGSAFAGDTEDTDTSSRGGNIPVNVKFSVFLLITRPEIALFKNPVWFERASSILLSAAKNYVGTRAYEALRGESRSDTADVETDDAFAGYMRDLNEAIPGTGHGFESEIGAKIVGAAIRAVDITAEGEEARSATLLLYGEEQRAKGIRAVADARRYELEQELDAVDGSPNGGHVRRMRAIERAGERGNTIIFTSGGDEKEDRVAANLLAGRKGEDPSSEGTDDSTEKEE